ncbi:MAG: response regulator [Limisphaerales bacterium]
MSARILLIEDNPDNLELMTYLLQASGYRPLAARDGEEGLAAARRERPDLIVCDIQIPKLDGYEVARELKRDSQLRPIPLVAVTAYAMVGDRDRILVAGFDGYIPKPIDPETFVSQLESFVTVRGRSFKRASTAAETLAATAEAQPEPSRARVLVVDDLPSKRYLVRSILEPSRYEVWEAGSVDEALARARQNPPDLIVSDQHMPQKSGVDLIREVQADPQLCRIPVLLHTATSPTNYDPTEITTSGTCFFLHSPIDPQRLLNTVQAILHPKGKN